MTLYIDTSEFGKVLFTLKDGKKVAGKKIFSFKPSETHKTLEFLGKFLKPQNITPPSPSPLRGGKGREESKTKNKESRITKIVVCKGPGGFTGIRVGVSLAQALAFAWKIPLRVLSKQDFVKML